MIIFIIFKGGRVDTYHPFLPPTRRGELPKIHRTNFERCAAKNLESTLKEGGRPPEVQVYIYIYIYAHALEHPMKNVPVACHPCRHEEHKSREPSCEWLNFVLESEGFFCLIQNLSNLIKDFEERNAISFIFVCVQSEMRYWKRAQNPSWF